MTRLVHVDNLGASFDVGVAEQNKIHVNVDNTTILRDETTGVLSVGPAAFVDIHLTSVAYTPAGNSDIPLNLTMSDGTVHEVEMTAAEDAFGVMLGYLVSA